MIASATSGAGMPASELRLLDAASTALSAITGAGFEAGVGCGACEPVGAGGVVPGGTPVVAVGWEGAEPGVEVVGAATAACLSQPPAARLEIASSSALGKSGAYCSMSLGTCCLAAVSCFADHLQAAICPVCL